MNIIENSISVIIPMFNSADSIIETLKSICKQTYLNYIKEILVINDGSKDDSPRLVVEYSAKSNIPVSLITKENGGVSSARNVGLEKASGEWIAFCDSDDLWLEDKIEKQVKIINDSGLQVDFIGGNHLTKTQYIIFKPLNKLHKMTVKEICIKSLPQTSTILMHKRIIKEIGKFDENQKYAEDGNFILRAIANFNCYYSPIQMVFYGNGKRGFGESGLSKNTKAMHLGELKNIFDMLKLGYITKKYYYIARIYCWLKYFRRLLIVFILKSIKSN